MTKLEQAARLALGALEGSQYFAKLAASGQAITSLREALAEQPPIPTAWINDKREMYLYRADAVRESQDGGVWPLYDRPSKALSDEEIDEIGVDFDGDYQTLRAFARRIEAAVKGEK